jgi:hypothetical protein
MYQGMGAVQERIVQEAYVLRTAIQSWSANPDSRSLQQALIGAAWRWGARVGAHMTANEQRLAAAINRWATAPGNPSYRQAMMSAMTAWSAAGLHGMGEYFAPTSGMGEYFAQNGVGEYFATSGLGAGEEGTFTAINVCSEECMKYVKADKRRLVLMTGSIALGLGLAAGIVVFR